MWFPAICSDYLRIALQPILSEVLDGCRTREATTRDLPQPLLLSTAFEQLVGVLARAEAGASNSATGDNVPLQQGQWNSALQPQAVSELGEYALVLLNDLARWVDCLDLPAQKQALMELVVATALWVSEHGGELLSLELVTDTLASFANNTTDLQRLRELHQAYDRIISSVVLGIQQDLEKVNPGRPWRVLHVNRAIVAARCHNTEFMESSFESLTSRFPEDAAEFFRQGMGQMDALGYPSHVRTVMERYYSQYTLKPALH